MYPKVSYWEIPILELRTVLFKALNTLIFRLLTGFSLGKLLDLCSNQWFLGEPCFIVSYDYIALYGSEI